jgi:nucleoside-diphosphate-sugar epimerase
MNYKNNNVMNILITGATGLIGAAILNKLIGKGHKIIGLSRSIKDDTDFIKWIQHDLYNDEILSLNLPKDIDVVYHLAGQTSTYTAKNDPIADLNINVTGFLNLLEYFKSVKECPFVVLAGTATEVGLVDDIPINEAMRDNPITFYDLSKLTAENYLKQYVREGWVRGCTLRLANVFGRNQKGQNQDRGIIDKIFYRALAKNNITIFGDGECKRDYIFIDDVAAAFILSTEFTETTNGLTFYIGSGNGVSLKSAFQKVISLAAKVTGTQVKCEHVTPPKELSDIEFRNVVIDSSLFTEATGWKPEYDFDSGLIAAYQSYFPK